MRVLMLAAENAALKGAKVGGMADVLRDLPLALQPHGVAVDMIMPDYGFLAREQQAEFVCDFVVPFDSGHYPLKLYRLPNPLLPDVWIYLLAHEMFVSPGHAIYTQDGPGRPFATDASKFALFCTAVATLLCGGLLPLPERLHLHDWHCGFFSMIRAFEPAYVKLQQIPTVLSIHNLAMQGIRPLTGDISSLQSWFPAMTALGSKVLAAAIDPRYPDCVNPLRAAINLSNAVHLVSPGYAEEVLQSSRPADGFFGGEGLELDLQRLRRGGKLFGILNGCNYNACFPELPRTQLRSQLNQLAYQALLSKLGYSEFVHSSEMIAQIRLAQSQSPQGFLLTSVGRLTDQKMLILRQPWQGGLVLDAILEQLASWDESARFWLLGNGDAALAREFSEVAARHHNFLFINGYHEQLSAALYHCGDLFLMPSSFEPCGISQMLALKAGQPCLVHGVGGLKDTVADGRNGFVFAGNNLQQQSEALLQTLARALALFNTTHWQQLVAVAQASRFEWRDSAREYVDKLYSSAN
ncbi:glycogen synthase [Shewanella dokdonensis]|uniref:glycogen synthase n=1 Tax=Shewanella dokdonensis TaxID=712036 RepID=UPI00200F3F07|nr:glycogen/starch synthase [Shewanella dokdonensis]MCL1074164.1 glycogen/starch synthase [Shewanella dokdonensis]